MWFIFVPILVYLGVGVVTYLILVVQVIQVIREDGRAHILGVDSILDAFRYEGAYEGVKEICSIFFWWLVFTIIMVLGSPLLWGLACAVYRRSTFWIRSYRYKSCDVKYQ